MNQFKAVIVIALLLTVFLVVPVWATPISDWLIASEISNAVSLPGGSHVHLNLEDIIKIKTDPAYIVIAEPFSGKDRLICLTSPNSELRLGQVVDVEGDLTTLPNGARALQNVTVWGYTSESGELKDHPSIIKAFPDFAQQSWPWKVDLTVRDSMASKASTLSVSVSSDEPNSDPAEGPTFYPRISGTSESTTTQTQGVRIQSFYPGIPNLNGLAAGSLVELQCKKILAADSETIGGVTYKYIDMAEDSSNQDWIRCYYNAGTPTTDNRINKITGQIRYTNNDTIEVICVDDGPAYNPQLQVGELNLVSPNTVAFVRSQANGASASLTGKVITANQTDFPGALYVQEPSGSGSFGGIRVICSGSTIPRGNLVSVTGTVALDADGERKIVDASVTSTGSTTAPGALGMPNKILGGSSFNTYCPGVSSPAGSGTGLYNKGLLVKSWGTVTFVDSTNKYFYIDDGTGFEDGTLDGNNQPIKGVRVSWAWSPSGKPAIMPPAVNWYVSVAG
ncbi:MAG: hypothetical protein ACYC0V_20995, partial [Armatimonadota bacterium]